MRFIESGDWGLIPIGIGTNVLYGKNRCELFADGGESDLVLREKVRKSFIECVVVLALGLGLASCSSDTTAVTGLHNLTFALKLSRDTASLYAGRTVQLTAVLKDGDGNVVSGVPIVWTSSSNDVATVSNDGLVTATKLGSATISATAQQVSATATITVLHDPIIFVHGFESSGAIWGTMIDRLKADGWTDAPLVTWTYDTHISNATIAQQLQAKTDSLLTVTGATKIDIIAHSMGGLSSRYFSKNLGGSDKIDALVFLGTPNHGASLANFCGIQSCLEMRPGSAFLTALNSGDETPGTARYATWWSPCDQAVTPVESPALQGATNTQTACIAHTDLYTDATVYAQVRAWIR
ncbi:MAG: Ig-like domain-containing protein [Gemmatimonadaceae bacterium]